MARAGKIISHDRQGQGKHHTHKWTTFRPGPINQQTDAARADMFVDVSPYVSLAGINTERQYSRRSATHLDEHAIARTRGKTLRGELEHRRREMPFGQEHGSHPQHRGQSATTLEPTQRRHRADEESP